MRLKTYFIVANILLIAVIAWAIIPERVFILQGQGPAIRLMERQLAIMEDNFRMYEENTALLYTLQQEAVYVIQPAGHLGALLAEVRAILHARNLIEQEFYASEQAFHYVDNQTPVAEIRTTLTADGSYDDISAFISDLAHHYRYLQIERIQISEAFSPARLWLTFSIYEVQ